jgi:hypothetical protein
MSHPLRDTIPAGKCACTHWARPDEVTKCARCDCEHHVASPYQGHDPQTPPGAETALQSFSDALDDATEKLKQARDAELEAEEARDTAKWEALLSPGCPKVGVFEGVRTTVAVQAAWVSREIAGEERAYKAAKVVRQAASAHLDKLNSQRSIAQTISKSVSGSYAGTGSEPWGHR